MTIKRVITIAGPAPIEEVLEKVRRVLLGEERAPTDDVPVSLRFEDPIANGSAIAPDRRNAELLEANIRFEQNARDARAERDVALKELAALKLRLRQVEESAAVVAARQNKTIERLRQAATASHNAAIAQRNKILGALGLHVGGIVEPAPSLGGDYFPHGLFVRTEDKLRNRR